VVGLGPVLHPFSIPQNPKTPKPQNPERLIINRNKIYLIKVKCCKLNNNPYKLLITITAISLKYLKAKVIPF
jgi:hypothetical protein